MHLQKMLLLEKINQRLSGAKFTDIHFQLDSSLKGPQKSGTAKPQEPKPVVDKNREREFDNLIGSLKDEEVKASLKSLWLKLQGKRRPKTEE